MQQTTILKVPANSGSVFNQTSYQSGVLVPSNAPNQQMISLSQPSSGGNHKRSKTST